MTVTRTAAVLALGSLLALGTVAEAQTAAPDPATGARAQPIYFTNGFVFDSTEQAAVRVSIIAFLSGVEAVGVGRLRAPRSRDH